MRLIGQKVYIIGNIFLLQIKIYTFIHNRLINQLSIIECSCCKQLPVSLIVRITSNKISGPRPGEVNIRFCSLEFRCTSSERAKAKGPGPRPAGRERENTGGGGGDDSGEIECAYHITSGQGERERERKKV